MCVRLSLFIFFFLLFSIQNCDFLHICEKNVCVFCVVNFECRRKNSSIENAIFLCNHPPPLFSSSSNFLFLFLIPFYQFEYVLYIFFITIALIESVMYFSKKNVSPFIL